MTNSTPADEELEGGGEVYKAEIEEYQKELDKSIKNIQKRISWLLAKLQTLEDDINTYNKTANSVSQLVSSLEKLMKLRGINFDTQQGESLAELLGRISNDVKKVEEVVKDAN